MDHCYPARQEFFDSIDRSASCIKICMRGCDIETGYGDVPYMNEYRDKDKKKYSFITAWLCLILTSMAKFECCCGKKLCKTCQFVSELKEQSSAFLSVKALTTTCSYFCQVVKSSNQCIPTKECEECKDLQCKCTGNSNPTVAYFHKDGFQFPVFVLDLRDNGTSRISEWPSLYQQDSSGIIGHQFMGLGIVVICLILRCDWWINLW